MLLTPIRQVVKVRPLKVARLHVLSQPQSLWNLHLQTHSSTNKLQHAFSRAVDQLGLVLGTMIRPENDVAFAIAAEPFLFADTDRNTLGVDDRQGACGIK